MNKAHSKKLCHGASNLFFLICYNEWYWIAERIKITDWLMCELKGSYCWYISLFQSDEWQEDAIVKVSWNAKFSFSFFKRYIWNEIALIDQYLNVKYIFLKASMSTIFFLQLNSGFTHNVYHASSKGWKNKYVADSYKNGEMMLSLHIVFNTHLYISFSSWYSCGLGVIRIIF